MTDDRRARHVLSIEEREWVAAGLRRLPGFDRLGQRLLADLVDHCWVFGSKRGVVVQQMDELVPKEGKGIVAQVGGPFLAISILKGTLQATARRAAKAKKAKAPAIAPSPGVGRLPVGTYGRFDAGLRAFDLGSLALAPPSADEEFLVVIVTPDVVKLAPETIRRLSAVLKEPQDLKDQLEKLKRPEVVWFDGESAHESLLRPMMHLLAAAVALAQKCPNVALVELGAHPEVARWDENKKGFVPIQLYLPPETDFRSAVDAKKPGSVFVLRPGDAANLKRVAGQTFDRIVYLAERIPRALPDHLKERLPEEVFDTVCDPDHQEPLFASFVPTVPVPFRNPPSGAAAPRFDTLQIAHSTIDEKRDRAPRGLRPYRDACIVPVRRAALRQAWAKWLPEWQAGKQTQFFDATVAARALRQESIERWERGVSMRRVGVALSGGGACAYRFVPVLEALHAQGIPIDVFAGLSGGALLGVFYCLRGPAGLNAITDLGPFIQATMPLASWTTAPYECTTDYLLGRARVENLEVRLGAVSVALPDDGPPHGAIVVQGTLGAAARASGTLPPTYAATEKNGIRYTDGGACTAVPARVARDCGADVTLACNAIPGPQSCNPFPPYLYGAVLSRILRRLPPWDRLIDFNTWRAFQWQQVSRHFGTEADAFLEFLPSSMSTAEPALFIFARQIIAAARAEAPKITAAVAALDKAWKNLI